LPVIAVLDTNVLLALWLFRDPVVEPVHAALAAGQLQPVRSAATDAEFAEVLARPGLFSVEPERQTRLLDAWRAVASLVEASQVAPWTCRDPLDQKFLDLAVSAGAGWLISRDRDLLKLARKTRRQGLVIVTPESWVPLSGGPR
jgi:putative PIN family toxin of toxin-antitoxin system